MDVQEMIIACQKNDRRAQKRLMETYASYMFGICKRYTRDDQEAKDVLQEAFISIYAHVGEFKSDTGAFKAWIRKITVNAALQKLRKSYQKKEIMHDVIQDSRTEIPHVLDKINVDDLLKVINKLPELYRHVFNLYVIEGYKHKDIGEMLGMKESSSRAVLARAKSQLRDYLTIIEKVAI